VKQQLRPTALAVVIVLMLNGQKCGDRQQKPLDSIHLIYITHCSPWVRPAGHQAKM